MGYVCDSLREIGHATRKFSRLVNMSDFDIKPRIYLEFTDMIKMRTVEMEIRRDLDSSYLRQEHLHNVDQDSVEIDCGGVSVVLRCMSRLSSTHGTDVGYTAIKFMEIKS